MSELSKLFDAIPAIEVAMNDQIENMPIEQRVLNMRGTIMWQMQQIDRLKGELEEVKKQYDGLYLQYNEAVFRESDTKHQLSRYKEGEVFDGVVIEHSNESNEPVFFADAPQIFKKFLRQRVQVLVMKEVENNG
jgi:hypothetical protein